MMQFGVVLNSLLSSLHDMIYVHRTSVPERVVLALVDLNLDITGWYSLGWLLSSKSC